MGRSCQVHDHPCCPFRLGLSAVNTHLRRLDVLLPGTSLVLAADILTLSIMNYAHVYSLKLVDHLVLGYVVLRRSELCLPDQRGCIFKNV